MTEHVVQWIYNDSTGQLRAQTPRSDRTGDITLSSPGTRGGVDPTGRFGCKFDGSTDDTAALVDAVEFCASYGYPLELPAGTAILSARLNVPANVPIIGKGKGVSIIKAATPPNGGAAAGIGVAVPSGAAGSDTSATSLAGPFVGFTFDGRARTATQGILLGNVRCEMYGVRVQAVNGTGLTLHQTQNSIFSSVDSVSCIRGIDLDYGANGNHFIRGQLSSNNLTEWLIRLGGQYVSGATGAGYLGCGENVFDGYHIEGAANAAIANILIEGGRRSAFRACRINNSGPPDDFPLVLIRERPSSDVADGATATICQSRTLFDYCRLAGPTTKTAPEGTYAMRQTSDSTSQVRFRDCDFYNIANGLFDTATAPDQSGSTAV